MTPLRTELAQRFRQSLDAKSVVSASRWAEKYRMMVGGDYPGLWKFTYFPWLREMHDSTAEYNCCMKGAQLGVSEMLLNIALFTMDVPKRNVLYIMPNQKPDASRFTTRAFNPAIEASEHIANMFSGKTNNVDHKIAGAANLFIGGSNTRSGLKSIPVSVILFDEFEEHDPDNTKLAEERNSGQQYRRSWKISTPTIPNKGIHSVYKRSTMKKFFFKCPSCSRMIQMKYPDSLVITSDDPDSPELMKSHYICYECKAILQHELKSEYFKHNEWVPEQPQSTTEGYTISQLYSSSMPAWKIGKLILESKRDPNAEQELMNSKLGMAHIIEGAQLTLDNFNQLIKDYMMIDSCRPSLVTLGADIGKKIHVVIKQWDITGVSKLDVNAKAIPKVLWTGEFDSWNQLDTAMVRYNVNFAVCDGQPEFREANAFALRWYGRAKTCRYNYNAIARSIFAGENDTGVSVNRTAWMDQALGRYRNNSIYLPNNLPRDYVEHLIAPVRVPSKDTQGNTIYKYETPDNVPDHYAHADTYAEIALPLAMGMGVNTNITTL
jgi:hypothetical protein